MSESMCKNYDVLCGEALWYVDPDQDENAEVVTVRDVEGETVLLVRVGRIGRPANEAMTRANALVALLNELDDQVEHERFG